MNRKIFKLTWPLLALIVIAPAFAADAPEVVYAGVDGVSLPQVKARSQISPFYPATARLTHVEAQVTVATTVEPNGKVSHVEVISCDQPDLGFEDSVVGAVRHWKFKPAEKDGVPVSSVTYISLHLAEPPPSTTGMMGGSSLVRASMVNPLAKTHQAMGPGRSNTATSAGITTASHGQPTPTRADRPPCRVVRCLYDRNLLNNPNRIIDPPTPVTQGSNRARAKAATGR